MKKETGLTVWEATYGNETNQNSSAIIIDAIVNFILNEFLCELKSC